MTELRRRADGAYRGWCLLCSAVGPVVPIAELIARDWDLDVVDDEVLP